MKTLLTHGSGGFEQLLSISYPVHEAYCRRHGFDFIEDRAPSDPTRAPAWQKIRMILRALRDGYDDIIWLDADCLILAPDVPLTEALRNSPITLPIGMVKYVPPYAIPDHWNTGAIYLRAARENRADLIDLFESAWDEWPVHHVWEDQIGINRALAARTHIACQMLDYKWNCTPNLPCAAPVVRAWHGHSLADRIRYMTEAVELAQA